MTSPGSEPVVAEQPPDGGHGRRRRIAPFVALLVAVVCAALFYVLLGADSAPNETAETPLLDEPAPVARGTLDDGRSFDLSRRKGSWVVLNFFQSSCAPCKAEHPDLVQFADQQAGIDDGAELYTIVFDDDRASVESFFDERGGDWPIVYDEDDSIAVSFGVSKVPETWIVDPDGIVRARVISRVSAEFLGTELQRLRELT